MWNQPILVLQQQRLHLHDVILRNASLAKRIRGANLRVLAGASYRMDIDESVLQKLREDNGLKRFSFHMKPGGMVYDQEKEQRRKNRIKKKVLTKKLKEQKIKNQLAGKIPELQPKKLGVFDMPKGEFDDLNISDEDIQQEMQKEDSIISYKSPYESLSSEEKRRADMNPDQVQAAENLYERLSGAIMSEQQYDRQQQAKLYQESSQDWLQRQGLIITELQAQFLKTQFGMHTYKLTLRNNRQLPFHTFQNGDNIRVQLMESNSRKQRQQSQSEDDYEKNECQAAILRLSKDQIELQLERREASQLSSMLTAKRNLRIDKFTKDATQQRQMMALTKLLKFMDNSQEEQTVRDIILGHPNAVNLASQKPGWCDNQKWKLAMIQRYEQIKNKLNPSQQESVINALQNTFTLWQGPPGTGKTLTMTAFTDIFVSACRASAQLRKQMLPVLVSADTNTAVDNVVEGLLRRNIKVVRVGVFAKVRPILRQFTVQSLAVTNTKMGRQIQIKRDQAQAIQERIDQKLMKAVNDRERQYMHKQLRELRGEQKQLEREAREIELICYNEIYSQAEVVATTCSSSGDVSSLAALSQKGFKMVILDEASQQTESSTLITLVQGAMSVVCAGDPQQLPPFVQSQEAREYNLDVTLFDRFINLGMEPQLLNTQYRMHPSISEFPSLAYYGGQIIDGELAQGRKIPQSFNWPNSDYPYAIIPCENGKEEHDRFQSDVKHSIFNRQEAQIVMELMQKVYEISQQEKIRSLAIISPYNGQVRHLEVQFSRLEKQLTEITKKIDINIATIDSFQGQEADFVIFSTVRCNNKNSVGFLTDKRRMNVALTRAKRAMVVVCSPSTLQCNNMWKQWLGWGHKNKLIMNSSNIGVNLKLEGVKSSIQSNQNQNQQNYDQQENYQDLIPRNQRKDYGNYKAANSVNGNNNVNRQSYNDYYQEQDQQDTSSTFKQKNQIESRQVKKSDLFKQDEFEPAEFTDKKVQELAQINARAPITSKNTVGQLEQDNNDQNEKDLINVQETKQYDSRNHGSLNMDDIYEDYGKDVSVNDYDNKDSNDLFDYNNQSANYTQIGQINLQLDNEQEQNIQMQDLNTDNNIQDVQEQNKGPKIRIGGQNKSKPKKNLEQILPQVNKSQQFWKKSVESEKQKPQKPQKKSKQTKQIQNSDIQKQCNELESEYSNFVNKQNNQSSSQSKNEDSLEAEYDKMFSYNS